MTDFRFDNENLIRRPFHSHRISATNNAKAPLASRSSKLSIGNVSFQSELTSQMKDRGSKAILKAANNYLGVRYEMGGGRLDGPLRSADCSSFVSRVYSDATNGRVKLTAYTDAMFEETVPIGASEAQPGDLVFYRGNDPGQKGTRFPHVAIYAGNGQVVDASSMLGRVGYHQISMGSRLHPEFRRVKAF